MAHRPTFNGSILTRGRPDCKRSQSCCNSDRWISAHASTKRCCAFGRLPPRHSIFYVGPPLVGCSGMLARRTRSPGAGPPTGVRDVDDYDSLWLHWIHHTERESAEHVAAAFAEAEAAAHWSAERSPTAARRRDIQVRGGTSGRRVDSPPGLRPGNGRGVCRLCRLPRKSAPGMKCSSSDNRRPIRRRRHHVRSRYS